MYTENQLRLMNVRDQANKMGAELYFNVLPKWINLKKLETGIEIGVLYGGHIKYLLENSNVQHIIGIDPYLEYGVAQSGCIYQQDFDDMYLIALKSIKVIGKRAEIIRAKSSHVFHFTQHNGSHEIVGFVFIDGDHSPEAVKSDIENYSQLVKPGGILSGHDYKNFEGVTRAVDEFAARTGKKIIEERGTVWIIEM